MDRDSIGRLKVDEAKNQTEKEPFLQSKEAQEFTLDPLGEKQEQKKVDWIPEIEEIKDESAIGRAGCCSRLFFSWSRPFLKQSQKGQLHITMFGPLRECDRVQTDLARLEGHYSRYTAQQNKNALFNAVFRTFRSMVMGQMLVGLAVSILNFSSPFMIFELTKFIKEGSEDPDFTWENLRPGVIYAGGLCGSQLLVYMLMEHMSYLNVLTGRRSSNAVIAYIYKKYSKISPATNKDFDSGQIVNFVQVDAQRLFWISYQMSSVVQLPFIFIVTFVLAFWMFGISFLVGFGVLCLAFVTNFIIGRILRRVQKKIMKAKDARMKITTEAISSIKMIKLYSWQENFLQRIYRRRDNDVYRLRQGGLTTAMLIFFIYFFPSLLPVSTFATYITLGHYLRADVAVASLVLFNMMRGPLIQAPIFFADLVQLRVSMRRIDKFCKSDEVQSFIKEQTLPQPANLTRDDNCVEVKGNYSWGFTSKHEDKKKATEDESEKKDEKKKLEKFITLQDINFSVKKGEFVSIIGNVRSGKSSLLQAIVGDLIYLPDDEIRNFGGLERDATQEELESLKNRVLNPEFQLNDKPIKIKGSVSYVEQGSWIQNKTIKDNIIFGNRPDSKRYKQTISACQLDGDLRDLPGGDMTEIGEKGINLSGGQKARVSLARAVYSNQDIIIMDDPISALDANVRKKIFTKVFQGILKDKTRILVTHAIDFLHLTDRICVLKDGKIQAFDTFEQLKLNNDPYLQEILDINKKNLEESKMMQQKALDSTRSGLLPQILEESVDQDSRHYSNPYNAHESQQRLNRSTMLLSSQNSSTFPLAQMQDSRDSVGIISQQNLSHQNQKEKLIYETEEKKPPQIDLDSDSDSSGIDTDEEELAEKTSDIDDAILKENAAKQAGKIIADEQDEIITVHLESYKKYLRYAGGWKLFFFFQLILALFVFLSMANNYYLQKWAYADQQEQNDDFYFYLIVLLSIVLFSALVILTRTLTQITAGLRVGKRLHNELIAYVFRAPINLFFDITPIGKILNRFSKDLAVLDEQIYYNFGGFFLMLWQSISCLVVASIAVPYILAVIAAFLVLVLFLFIYSMRAYKDCYRIESVTMSPILSYMQETFNGNSVIRAFGREEEFVLHSQYLVNKTTCANQITIGVFAWYSLRLDLLVCLILASGCSAVILLRTSADPILLSMMLQYLITLQSFIKFLMMNFGEIERKMVSGQRLFDIEKIPQERSGQQKIDNASWPSKGALKFKDVELRYRPNTELCLCSLSFEVEAGTKVGVVGRTGAGKSTMSMALTRIVEICGGSIEIDGVNISEIDINQVRDKITVIAQDPTLFTGTIRFNVDPFRQHSNAAIEQLLYKAGLSGLLNREPEKIGGKEEDEVRTQAEQSSLQPTNELNTSKRSRRERKKKGTGIYFKISEGGKNLSAGEKQLICICRAILRKNKVVVLDEATANIDIATEKKIQELIEQEFAQSTVITIAHRLNTIIKSDKVLVLSKGQKIEFDTPSVLMENPESHFSGLLKELKQKKEEENQQEEEAKEEITPNN